MLRKVLIVKKEVLIYSFLPLFLKIFFHELKLSFYISFLLFIISFFIFLIIINSLWYLIIKPKDGFWKYLSSSEVFNQKLPKLLKFSIFFIIFISVDIFLYFFKKISLRVLFILIFSFVYSFVLRLALMKEAFNDD